MMNKERMLMIIREPIISEKEYNEIDKKIIEISNAKSRENVKESNNNKNNIVMNMIGRKREPGFIDIFDEEHKKTVS